MPRKKKTHGAVESHSSPPTPYKGPVTSSQLVRLTPLTPAQEQFVAAFDAGVPCILLHGMAGTGKTFMAVYKALQDALMTPTSPPENPRRVIILRSAVPSRDIGFLPGDEDEKLAVYQLPYQDVCAKLVQHPQGFTKLCDQNQLEFWSTSFLRGLTIDNAIVLVDECQNMTDMELHSIMTRLGKNSRIVWCGDFRQTDLNKSGNGSSGLKDFMHILERMPDKRVTRIEFGIDDIVRSALVKDYLIAREEVHARTRKS